MTTDTPVTMQGGCQPQPAIIAWNPRLAPYLGPGRLDSPTRIAEQTDVARFYSTNAIVQYNTAFKQIVLDRGLDAVQAARLYAMWNLVGADALIACFDAKYHYLFWRPQFAIPQGDTDGNPDTAGDPTWTPLLATPNHPEYPPAHGCFSVQEIIDAWGWIGFHYRNSVVKGVVQGRKVARWAMGHYFEPED